MDKKKAFDLRKKTLSYGQISKELGVSKSTLSAWFRDADWSARIAAHNHLENHSPEMLRRMQERRKALLADRYLGSTAEAETEFRTFRRDPLFMAGVMLYLSNGDCSESNQLVRISNSQPYPVVIFKRFIETYAPLYLEKIRISLLLYPNLEEKRCLAWWSALTGVKSAHFHRSQRIKGRDATKKLLYGVATLTISSKALKIKLLRWVELSSKELANAGMV